MIELKEMRAAVDIHLDLLAKMTDEEINADLPNHIRMIVVHLERLHRNLAVHIETLG